MPLDAALGPPPSRRSIAPIEYALAASPRQNYELRFRLVYEGILQDARQACLTLGHPA